MKAREVIRCRGHPNIRARHPTTFEVTTEESLTTAGDCIIAVEADKGAADLSPEFKKILTDDRALLSTTLTVHDIQLRVTARGNSAMTLDHPTDLVWRKSGFVCGRTVGIFSDYVGYSIPRNLINALRSGANLMVEMVAIIPDPAD